MNMFVVGFLGIFVMIFLELIFGGGKVRLKSLYLKKMVLVFLKIFWMDFNDGW